MLQMHVPSLRRIGPTRQAVRDELHGRHYAEQHVTIVETVVAELLGAAHESQAESPIVITVERFALLISVRVRCSEPVDILRLSCSTFGNGYSYAPTSGSGSRRIL